MNEDPRVGTTIGEYEVESVLGRGGMGVVYLARHPRLGRRVALKLLPPELTQDEAFRERFLRESRIAAATEHPNVIPVYDAGEVDGALYIAMRYVEGTDLKELIRTHGPLAPHQVVALVSQVAGALEAAHERGLIHRDIKPANILVGGDAASLDDAHAYLTDFGLTKQASSQSGLSQAGTMLGTIDYMPPEQIEGRPLDRRSDVYALGCVLYESLTGRVPFERPTEVATVYAHLMDPPPVPSAARPELSASFDEVVATAMSKDPDDRYPTARALASALRAAGMGHGSQETASVSPVATSPPAPAVTTTGTRRRLSPRTLVAGTVTLLLAAAAVAYATGVGDGGNEERDPSASSAVAGALYVGPQGASGAAGTAEDPLGSLQEAVDQAGPGDRVLLLDGTYEATTTPMVVIEAGGDEGAPLTIAAAPGATPVLRGTGEHVDGMYVSTGVSHLVVEGVTFENFPGDTLKVFCEECSKRPEHENLTFSDVTISDGGFGLIVENGEGVSLTDVTVSSITTGDGIACIPGPCNDMSLQRVTVEDVAGRNADGIHVESGARISIEDTTVTGSGGDGFDIAASDVTLARTQALDNGLEGFFVARGSSAIRDSIAARNDHGGIVFGRGGVFTIANCLVAENGQAVRSPGVSVGRDGTGRTAFELFNTIITSNNGDGVVGAADVEISRFDFNLFNTGSASNTAVIWGKWHVSENDLNHSRFMSGKSPGTYASAPVFVGPDDYHLEEGSAGFDGGTSQGASDTALDGTPRPQGKEVDMGPYEQ